MSETATPTTVRPDIQWKPASFERYMEMLEVLWPACNMSKAYGFLVGEPRDHGECTVRAPAVAARYAAFLNNGLPDDHAGACYAEADRAMTKAEFFALSKPQIAAIFANMAER